MLKVVPPPNKSERDQHQDCSESGHRSLQVEVAIVNVTFSQEVASFREGLASTYPEPENIEEFIRAQLYDYNYNTALPSRYAWPQVGQCKAFL